MKTKNNIPVVYQIYPKSFKDTNGDGIGDIQGIIEKLDYLQELGIDLIWITPIFVSPQRDNGYDVADYRSIDPLFGTMETVEKLIAEAKKRDIGIMFDMVLNHTSTNHEWFQKALTDKHYQNYYFFKEQPTNWESKFGGNAWQYVEDLNLYYLHLYDTTQADLNWENPEVFQALCDIVNFWLAKGIQGLRFDVINLVSKPDTFEDDYQGDGRRFYTDGPRIHQHLQRLNKATFGKREGIVTVGELSSTSIENGVRYATPENETLTTVFNFHHLKVDYKDNQKWAMKAFDFIELKTIMMTWQNAMQDAGAMMSLFLNNHDQPRSISRFTDDTNHPFASATMLGMTFQLMKGMPYIYQGEEIGLPNAYFDDIQDYRDVESLNMHKILLEKHSEKEVIAILKARSRDNGRTPIPWNHDKNHGFTTGMPWLPISKHPRLLSVSDNLENPNSIFHFYKKIIKLRKTHEIIQTGTISFTHQDDAHLFVYHRQNESGTLSVISNFYGDRIAFDFQFEKTAQVWLSNYDITTTEGKTVLQPYESIAIFTPREV